jgi:hypothetical protein
VAPLASSFPVRVRFPLWVLFPFNSGIVAPDVPVLTVAAVPSPRFVLDVAALATSLRLFVVTR